MGFVASLRVYPVKSLDPVELAEVRVNEWGSLEYDRVYAIFDSKGRVVNGKRESRLHLIRTRYHLRPGRVVVYASYCCSPEEAFELDDETGRFSRWLSRVLGYDVEVRANWEGGFPDDTEYNGPTIVSTATLVALASWLPGWDLRQARHRIRANIEVGGVPAFWEDQLNAYSGDPVRVRVGDVILEGWNISRRCVVPSRDPFTGAIDKRFAKVLRERRPPIPGLKTEDKFRLAANTRIPAEWRGRTIRLYDSVKLLKSPG